MAKRIGMWNFDPSRWPAPKGGDSMLEGIRVDEVLDGDTIRLEDGTVVRYIGIDAPESPRVWNEDALGHQAYERNRDLVKGKLVSLEDDVEFNDPRGRELAYVYVDVGGQKKMVNAILV